MLPGAQDPLPADPAYLGPWDSLDEAATRHMCAGAYVDREFRKELLARVYCDRQHRLPPSYGFDLVPVLVHAWRAWVLESVQDIALLLILTIAAFLVPSEAAVSVAILLLWFTGRGLVQFLNDGTEYVKKRMSISEYEQIKVRGKLFWYGFIASFLILFVGTLQFIIRIRPHSLSAVQALLRHAIGSLVILCLLAAVIGLAAAIKQMTLGYLGNNRAVRIAPRSYRLTAVSEQQFLPLTVYSVYKPFIGAGTSVQSWSFAQRLVRFDPTGLSTDQEYDELPFRTKPLVNRLQQRIEELRSERDPEARLPGLVVADHVFIEGTYAEQYWDMLKGGLPPSLLAREVDGIIANPRESARHFLRCQIRSWGGEVVTSIFVHVSLQGRTLYIEFSSHALEPVRRAYWIIDERGKTGVASIFRSTGRSLTTLPDALISSLRVLHVPVRLAAAARAGSDAPAAPRTGVNIGAEFSAREAASSGKVTYFQNMDVFKHSKIIERRLIATVADFLKERGVDTSEFLLRSTQILNNGIINTGSGQVDVSGSVMGEGNTVAGAAT
jgi:hypothetical protein